MEGFDKLIEAITVLIGSSDIVEVDKIAKVIVAYKSIKYSVLLFLHRN